MDIAMPGHALLVVTVLTCCLHSASLVTAAANQNERSSAGPAFDVISIRKSPDPSTTFFNPTTLVRPGRQWNARFATVEGIIKAAYPAFITPGQIAGGPSWLREEFFEIAARTDEDATADEVRGMIRALLADRFKLVLREEKRQLEAYALRRPGPDSKLGRGLRPPEIDCMAYAARGGAGAPPAPPPGPPKYNDRLPCVATMMPSGAATRLTAGGKTLANILPLLSRELGKPVVDETGITDTFDIDVYFTRDLSATPDPDAAAPLLVAVRDWLGLSLEKMSVPSAVLVVERVERPTPN
jgi:uncharacterized protein (TIGR03435 family)